MEKNGFTLVELLAVIAILAILVIVAMPNVLGMFNEAKANTFVTEVQKYIDAAKTAFVNDALSNQGKVIYYSSEYNDDLKTSKLDMDGSKDYFIEMDRHGDFKRIIIKDDSFCYDIYASGSTIDFDNSKSKKLDDIQKGSVNVNDVWNSETTDSIVVSHDGSNFKVKGCEAVTTIEGKSENVVTDVVKIDDIEYKYIPGMTWGDWFNSDYSKNFKNKYLDVGFNGSDMIVIGSGSNRKYLAYTTDFCNFDYGYSSLLTDIDSSEVIVKNEDYQFVSFDLYLMSGYCHDGESYYYGDIKYIMDKKVYEAD